MSYAIILTGIVDAMSHLPKTFGKYLLLDKIASGGMAEIFLAQTTGPGGFEKRVALKRILPPFGSDQEFISMFVDEAKITSQLTHSNIVQIYEFGHETVHADQIYYLAMEYVDGKNLREILARCEEIKRPIPIEHAVYIAGRICNGLDYAHRFRDKHGQESLQIIHRDISPQNILVSYEGEVKLIDFGIAKTRARSGKTKSGVLKGKFGYMSPEQASGEMLDQRTDIFSTGIILFEMLTRQRLFHGSSDLNTLKKIQEAKVPAPSLFNPDIPFDLEEIILKALEKDRNKRIQTAREFHQALSRFLNTLNPEFTSGHTASFLRSLFALDILHHKKRMNELLISISPPPPQETPSATSRENVTQKKTKPDLLVSTSPPKTLTEIKIEEEPPTPEAGPSPEASTPKKMWLQLSVMGLAILTLSMLLLVLNQNPDVILRQPQHLEEKLSLTKPSAIIKKSLVPEGTGFVTIRTLIESDIEIDGRWIGRSPVVRFPLAAGRHQVRATDKESSLIAETEVVIKKDEHELLDEDDLVFRPPATPVQ